MNRHQKRRQAAAIKKAPQNAVLETMGAIQDFAETVDKLKPYLAVIRQMAEKIDDCISVIRDVELRNDALKAELALQREVTLRLAQRTLAFQAAPLDTIRLLEAQIQEEILKESTANGTSTEPTEPAAEQDPSPGAEVGLASPASEGDSAG